MKIFGDLITYKLESTTSGPNMNVLKDITPGDVINLFFTILSTQTWEKINLNVNNVLLSRITNKEVTGDNIRHFSPLLIKDLLQFFGIWILLAMEYTPLKNSLNNNFKQLKSVYHWKMGLNRFTAIQTSLLFDSNALEELCNDISSTFKSLWNPSATVSFDESIWAYEPRPETKRRYEYVLKDPIPVVYIPRKPHPNGFLCWLLVSKSSKTNLPFILDIIPHVRFPQISAQQAIRRMLSNWIYPISSVYRRK